MSPRLPLRTSLRQALPGFLLFLFIPLVLYLFVAHPEPVGVSLLLGIVLMVGHRLLARPHMEWARIRKCLWCGRPLAGDAAATEVEVIAGGRTLRARTCPRHLDPAARFFAFVHRWRMPLRLAIFLPLLTLLVGLALHALGPFGEGAVPIESLTAGFQLIIGLTVNVAAWGYLTAQPRQPLAVPFPVHNFFLLGVQPLLWILRLVGIWWIVKGLSHLLL